MSDDDADDDVPTTYLYGEAEGEYLGTGEITTVDMTPAEKAAARKRERVKPPLGFVVPEGDK